MHVLKRFLSAISALGLIALGFGALGAMPVMASTTFNVPCGNIKLLEQAVATPGATINLAYGCTYHLLHEFNSPVDSNPYSGTANDDELPAISGSLIINGHGSTLQGIPVTSAACCGRILELDRAGTLTLNAVRLSGGRLVIRSGGGLLV